MRATIRLPGSSPIVAGPITDVIDMMAPVCKLSQDKWAAPYTITADLLSDIHKGSLDPNLPPYDFTPNGVRHALHIFGRRLEGKNYIGTYLRRFDGQRQEVHATIISYRYEWEHDSTCDKKHCLPKAEELISLGGFTRPPAEPYWVVNWAECYEDREKL